jgi:endonuclease/exonuclease/phosphatase family metal-dependent hydrolase
VAVLLRSWNLFHGNTVPPGRKTYLAEMVRLASADAPDVLLLQEVPVWALARLGSWSGMTVVADVAQPARVGPLRIPAELGRVLTALHPGVLRSAFSGQGNAILVGRGLQPALHEVVTLNPPGFRRAQARRLRLDRVARLAWANERRICQVVRLEPRLVVANLHATSFPGDERIAGVEVERAAAFVEGLAHEGDAVVLGGDLNVRPGSPALAWSPTGGGPRIDHLLVRGAEASPLRVWPDERRRRDGMLLSDHAPVELDLSL